jgi:hypothetical protein
MPFASPLPTSQVSRRQLSESAPGSRVQAIYTTSHQAVLSMPVERTSLLFHHASIDIMHVDAACKAWPGA